MYNKDKNNRFGYSGFSNDKQKKFFLISRAFKIGNIIIVVIAIMFAAKYLFGV